MLEQMRETAEKDDTRGPITMIMESRNVGKSILCGTLLNYAIRTDRRPIFVDLDVNQEYIAISDTVGALLIERPYNAMKGFNQENPLVFHFGYKNPRDNSALYESLITQRSTRIHSKTIRKSKRRGSL